MSWRSRLLPLALTGVAVAGVAAFLLVQRPVPVDAAAVTAGPLEVFITDDGLTQIRERYTISSPLAGRQRRIDLDIGDRVEAGETLLTVIEPIDPALLDERAAASIEAEIKAAAAIVEQRAAELKRARESHELATRELVRGRKMAESSTVAARQLDLMESEDRMAAAAEDSAAVAVRVARFRLELAQAAQLRMRAEDGGSRERLSIRSPIDGCVLRIFEKSAAVLPAGRPLMELGDPRDLEVKVDVLSRDAVRIKPGATVAIVGWGGPRPLRGQVRRVSPSAFTKVSALGVDEQRVYVMIDLLDPPEDRAALGDGYRVEARILVDRADQALKLPIGALFRSAGAWSVYAIEEGSARLKTVSIGRKNDQEAELLGGLAEGARVILYPSDRIEEGLKVAER